MSTKHLSKIILAVVAASSLPPAALAEQQSWGQLQKLGSEALDSNKYWIAEPTLKQAVIVAGGFGPADMRLAKSFGELGRLYTVRGRFDEAEPYMEEQLHVTEMSIGSDNPETIPAKGWLIRFYLKYGTAAKADPLTEELLAFVEAKLKEGGVQTHSKMSMKKGVPLEGWVGEAAPVIRDPLIEWAITCDELGNLYRLRDNYELADRLFKAALDIKSTVLGKEHLSLANSYDSLGMLALVKGDTAQAQTYFTDALATTERILPSDDPQVYARIDKLAKCLIKAGKQKQAEDLYRRALGFWKDATSKSADQARTLYALGCLYCDGKNYEGAAPLLAQALVTAESVHGPSSVALVPYLEKYAYALYYLGRKPEVAALRARADGINGGFQ